jgi:hypothetical protein
MEPFREDELSDQELDAILREWKAPGPPAHLRAALFPDGSRGWWRKVWSLSIRVPVPVMAMVAIMLALAAWRGLYQAEPRERTGHELQPVAELRPVIIRSGE